MPRFSTASIKKIEELHPDLQEVLSEAIRHYDFTVICGHRGKEEQTLAFNRGLSNAQWPYSKHNSKPAKAVDLAPWPINWANKSEFYYMAGVVITCARQIGVSVRWGGRWKSIIDLPHFELNK